MKYKHVTVILVFLVILLLVMLGDVSQNYSKEKEYVEVLKEDNIELTNQLKLNNYTLLEKTKNIEVKEEMISQKSSEIEILEKEKKALEEVIQRLESKEKQKIARSKPSPRSGYRQDELDLLVKICYAEARGESAYGQRAVANVILNRVESDKFPNTIRDVIYQKNQFCGVKTPAFNQNIPQEFRDNIFKAVSNRELPRDVLFFKATYSKTNWSYSLWQVIGIHEFYTY